MVVALGIHRPYHTQAICMPGKAGIRFSDLNARLAMFRKTIRACHRHVFRFVAHEGIFVLPDWQWLAVQPRKRRLGIEQIHMAGTTIHEQKDHRLARGAK